jgi:ATP-binding cassette, subfamily B, multidrug efflux pump
MTQDFYADEKATTTESEIPARKAFSALWPFMRKHRRRILVCLSLLLIATILSAAWPALIKHALDDNVKNGDTAGLIYTVLVILAMQAVALWLMYVQRIQLERIGQDIIVELKRTVFDHMLSLDVSYFNSHPVGRLMARVESDTEALRMFLTNAVVIIIADIILLSVVLSIMFYFSVKLTLVLLIFAPVMLVLIIAFERFTTPRFMAVRKSMAEVVATVTEFLHGVSIVQVFDRKNYAIERLNTANAEKFRNDAFTHVTITAFFNVLWMMENLIIGTLLYVAGKWIVADEMTVGVFSTFMVLIWRSFEPIYRGSEQMFQIQRGITGARRIFGVLSERSSVPEPEHPHPFPHITKGIRFENVWFSYDNDENWTLKDVSFDIPCGKRVALAGVTGGGKTTVISLLLRFYDPQKGRITIDGVDIRRFSRSELRRNFALVLQDIFLFPDEVRNNVALGSTEVSQERIEAATRTVEAHAFIERLPAGYKTQVSEKGSNFSRGERQLLSFARALVVNPQVLLLDEATSSVDPATERTIQASLKTLMQGRTSLIIAHRLSTILDVDEIIVIRQGEIVERGTHIDLILQKGYYSKLFHLQFKGSEQAVQNV